MALGQLQLRQHPLRLHWCPRAQGPDPRRGKPLTADFGDELASSRRPLDLPQIDQLFELRISARKFGSHQLNAPRFGEDSPSATDSKDKQITDTHVE